MASKLAKEVEEMEMLMRLKDLYGWEDDDKQYKKRKDAIFKAFSQPEPVVKKEKHEAQSAPKILSWETVTTIKAKDWDEGFNKLHKHIEGEWKADKWSRGGFVTFEGELKLPWRRRMTTDGKKFARLIHTKKGMVIQRATIGEDLDFDDMDEEMDEKDEEELAQDDADDADAGDVEPERVAPKSAKAKKDKKRARGEDPEPTASEPKPARPVRAKKPKRA